MRRDDRLHEREPQPQAALRTASIPPVEPVEDARQVVGRDPDAVVLDLEDRRVPLGARRSGAPARLAGVYFSALSRRFASTWRIRTASTARTRSGVGLHAEVDSLLLGSVREEVHGLAEERPGAHGSTVSRMAPDSASDTSIISSRSEETRWASSSASPAPRAGRRGRPATAAPVPRPRAGAPAGVLQVVGDVVERPAHRGHQPGDLHEERVEGRTQLVQRVARARGSGRARRGARSRPCAARPRSAGGAAGAPRGSGPRRRPPPREAPRCPRAGARRGSGPGAPRAARCSGPPARIVPSGNASEATSKTAFPREPVRRPHVTPLPGRRDVGRGRRHVGPAGRRAEEEDVERPVEDAHEDLALLAGPRSFRRREARTPTSPATSQRLAHATSVPWTSSRSRSSSDRARRA